MNKLNGKLIKLNSDIIGIDELKKRKRILTEKERNFIKQREAAQERISKIEKIQIELDELLDTYDEEILSSGLTEQRDTMLRLNRTKIELDKVFIKRDSLNDRLIHLKSHKYNPECDICLENSKSIISTKKEVEEEMELLDIEITQYNMLVHDLKEIQKNNPDYEKQWTNFIETRNKENKINNELSTLINRITTFETEEVKISNQIFQQSELIDEYYTNENQIKKNKEIRISLVSVREDLSNTKTRERRLNSDILNLNGKLSSLKTQKENIQSRIDEVKSLEQQTKLYSYYLNALSKDGISYELIEKALPMIEGEVNNILAQIVEFGIQFEIDGKSINAYIVYGDQRWSLEMSSGMERFISGLAIRVALINICNLPRSNFLVIDEGFGTLDSENMQSLFQLFTYLKTQFDFVMIISHIDSLRDVVDDLIEIKKEDGFSHVKF